MNLHDLLAWVLGGAAIWAVLVFCAFLIRWDVVAALETGTGTAVMLAVAALFRWWRNRGKDQPPAD
ncbi:hypothetical protein HD597_009585 [Nonomuraea thailandensis]|uniref:DUF2530 domain-containing protein n=1 Tax=Nonomuraea thailandensis TaxID=1188745 RepID=A0A9X2GRB2_9ACTN|nr:hypothetical protein [Nonomuraea thailandensis]MCP2362565.1 hypothetical protein [Nonomuraea thailandensis]